MSFGSRLKKAKAKSALTVSELAEWFGGVSKQTVWLWATERFSPQKYRAEQTEKSLGFLEKELMRKTPRLPLPMSVRLGDRIAHVREIRASYR